MMAFRENDTVKRICRKHGMQKLHMIIGLKLVREFPTHLCVKYLVHKQSSMSNL